MLKCDYLVIGAGETGINVSTRLAILGKKVILIEKDDLGGSFLYEVDFPRSVLIKESKRFESSLRVFKNYSSTFKTLLDYRKGVIKKLENAIKEESVKIKEKLKENGEIKIISGVAEFCSDSLIEVNSEEERHLIAFDKCIITVGENNKKKLEIKGLSECDSWDRSEVYNFVSIPKVLGLVGLTLETLEIAHIYSNLGINVEIFEKKSVRECLPELDRTALNYTLKKLLVKQVKIHFSWQVESIANPRKNYILTNDKGEKAKVDKLFVSSKKTFSGGLINLSKVGINYTQEGIKCDKNGKIISSNKNLDNKVFALGDCNALVDCRNKNAIQNNFFLYLSNLESQKTKKIFKKFLPEFGSCSGIRVPVYFIDSFYPVLSVGYTEFSAISKFGPQIKTYIFDDDRMEGLMKIIYKASDNEMVGIVLMGDYVLKSGGLAVKSVEKKDDYQKFVDFVENYLRF